MRCINAEETNRLVERSNDLYCKKRELEERIEKNKYSSVISDNLKLDLKEIEEEYKKHQEIKKQKFLSFFKEDWGQWLRKGKVLQITMQSDTVIKKLRTMIYILILEISIRGFF